MKHVIEIEHGDLVTILAALLMFEQLGSPKAADVQRRLFAQSRTDELMPSLVGSCAE